MKYLSERLKTARLKKTASKARRMTKNTFPKVTDLTKKSSQNVKSFVLETFPATLSFFSLPELLKCSEKITKTATTFHYKNLDEIYLLTLIGGGNCLSFATQPNRRFEVELGYNRRFKKIEHFCIDWRFAVNILCLFFLSQNQGKSYG